MSRVRLERASKGKAGIHYFVVATVRDGKRLVTAAPQEVADERAARHRIETMARSTLGMAAYEVELDNDGEAVSEPALIARAGQIPGLGIEGDAEEA